MRRLRTTMLLLLVSGILSAQSTAENYIRSRRVLNEANTSWMDRTVYYDGLGRPYQTLEQTCRDGSLTGKNLISVSEYDANGREANRWLPIQAGTTDYLPLADFKASAAGQYANDACPYAQSVYEASALDRVIEEYGPGEAWREGSHAVRTDYLTNGTDFPLSCKDYSESGEGALVTGGIRTAGTLKVTRVTDEDGHVRYTFTDKLGKVLLERMVDGDESFDTYYLYNDYRNLLYVLQPAYQDSGDLSKHAFRYAYDYRQRLIERQAPGAEPVVYEYDTADRLTFSQDGVQRVSNRWTYYEYDALNRLTEQGECNGKDTSSKTVRVKNYYDNYDFRSQPGFNNGNFPAGTVSAKGYLTGSEMTMPGSTTRLYTAYYYDIHGRVTRTVQSNLLGGYDKEETVYTFDGRPQKVTRTHTASGKTTQTEVYDYTYDHAARLTKVEHTLNGSKVTLATYAYDELGRLQSRTPHGNAANKLTYSYNIRDWVTGISGAKFSQSLYYTDGVGIPQYNGNISSMTWRSGDETALRGYQFTYDGLNRLTLAKYGENPAMDRYYDIFNERVTAYDKNGNILGLQRNGQIGAGDNYGMIDNLTYTLNGNQLARVDDAATASAYNGGFEFRDAVQQADEYAYDANGNLTKDLNRNISEIQYNFLNLPSKVVFGDGSTIEYVYAADGTKLRTVHNIGGTTTTTDYCGNVVYENGTQKYLLTEEGYVTLADNKYHYYLQDHQGNNRVVVDGNGTVEEVNHYYPFGGTFASTSSVQPYKYNGKEFDTKNGLNWYDYGARMYDPSIGRWNAIDPSADDYCNWTPYAYCKNSPIMRIDIDGKDDYVISSRGNITQRKVTSSKVDYVYYDHIGSSQYITIADKQLLPAMFDAQYNFEKGYSTIGKTNNLEDAAKLFKFGADNTGVEWKIEAYSNEGNTTFAIGTDHKSKSVGSVAGSSSEKAQLGDKKVDIHSHPSQETQGASIADQKSIDAPHNAVYFKKDGTLHEYNKKNNNLNSMPIKTSKDLEEYIKSRLSQ